MNNNLDLQDSDAPRPGIGLPDIVRMLFKHKWKLILFTLVSLGGAAAVYFTHTAQYESTSTILVRYVEEVSNVDPGSEVGRVMPTIESVIGAEVAILQSWDLAEEVADVVTPAVILANTPGASRSGAAQVIMAGLEVVPQKGGRVITITYRHREPQVAVKALNALVKLYQEKHVEIHRATKSRETSRSRRTALTAKISELSESIEQAKSENGISSLTDAATGLNKRSDELRFQTAAAEADLQEQVARMGELKRLGLVKEATPAAAAAAADDAAAAVAPAASTSPPVRAPHFEYLGVMKRLTQLQDDQTRLEKAFSSGSPELKQNRAEMAALDAQRLKLEIAHPSLLATGPALTPGAPAPQSIDPMVETVRLATLSARVQFLQKRQEGMKEEFKKFSAVSKRLHELERERDLQSEGLRQFAGTFQRNEFETPLTAEQYDNIFVVQGSSPPSIAVSKLYKLMGGIAGGGIAIGLALVAFLELFLNRSVKRPLELESRVGIPLMLHIPHIHARERRALPGRKRKSADGPAVTGIEAWSSTHFIRPYADALRDRLVLHFEQIGLTRKPKLVGVSSYAKGAGVSTVASGIAAALSETGDGKVLLVDLNLARAEVHPFFEGKPAATLTEALEGGDKLESAAENLYLATAATTGGGAGQLFPKRFYDMLPNFQASDFDYIIFDMPPLNESSLTLAMSGFMDQLLLVVEAEKDNRDAVKRASAELIRARAKLSGVLNKTRAYGPKWLQEA